MSKLMASSVRLRIAEKPPIPRSVLKMIEAVEKVVVGPVDSPEQNQNT
jgi:hypothetical protein